MSHSSWPPERVSGFRKHEWHAEHLTTYRVHEHATLALIKVVLLASRWLDRPGNDVERIWDTRARTEVNVKDETREDWSSWSYVLYFYCFVFFQMYTWLFWKMLYQSLTRGIVETWWLRIIHYCFFFYLFHFTFLFKRTIIIEWDWLDLQLVCLGGGVHVDCWTSSLSV